VCRLRIGTGLPCRDVCLHGEYGRVTDDFLNAGRGAVRSSVLCNVDLGDILPASRSKMAPAVPRGSSGCAPRSSGEFKNGKLPEDRLHDPGRYPLPQNPQFIAKAAQARVRRVFKLLARRHTQLTTRASSDSGTVRPSIRAVTALITSSNLLDCTTAVRRLGANQFPGALNTLAAGASVNCPAST
jgi:hypothetical protein